MTARKTKAKDTKSTKSHSTRNWGWLGSKKPAEDPEEAAEAPASGEES